MVILKEKKNTYKLNLHSQNISFPVRSVSLYFLIQLFISAQVLYQTYLTILLKEAATE